MRWHSIGNRRVKGIGGLKHIDWGLSVLVSGGLETGGQLGLV